MSIGARFELNPTKGSLYEAVASEHTLIAEGIWNLLLSCPPLSYRLQPGQFLSIALQNETQQLSRIPLSFVHTAPQDGLIDLVFEVRGPGTQKLVELRAGETVSVLGPLGHGWQFGEPQDLSRVLLVAGGTGTVPIFAAALWCKHAQVPFDCVIGARKEAFLWGNTAFKNFQAGSVMVTTDDGSFGEKGFASGPALRLLRERAYDLVLVCGPEPLMEVVSQAAIAKDVPCQVSLERTMACGFGACNTCSVKTIQGMKSACLDGPVFDAKEVIW